MVAPIRAIDDVVDAPGAVLKNHPKANALAPIEALKGRDHLRSLVGGRPGDGDMQVFHVAGLPAYKWIASRCPVDPLSS